MRIGVRCSSYCTHLHAGLDFSAYAPYARLHFQCNPVCQGFICVTCQERTHTHNYVGVSVWVLAGIHASTTVCCRQTSYTTDD